MFSGYRLVRWINSGQSSGTRFAIKVENNVATDTPLRLSEFRFRWVMNNIELFKSEILLENEKVLLLPFENPRNQELKGNFISA